MALFGNIGGTSTMIGDPPNLIIGRGLHSSTSQLNLSRF
jgi:Na+/H+ antiporter NhaD/arsenite permease-like protein